MKPTVGVGALLLVVVLFALAQPTMGAWEGRVQRIARLDAECEKGMHGSCFTLGVMLEEGNGVAKETARAAKLYGRACNAGHADACSNLGVLHESGDGVTKDLKLAMTLYQRGCDEGGLVGCTNLGANETHGVGLPEDQAL